MAGLASQSFFYSNAEFTLINDDGDGTQDENNNNDSNKNYSVIAPHSARCEISSLNVVCFFFSFDEPLVSVKFTTMRSMSVK